LKRKAVIQQATIHSGFFNSPVSADGAAVLPGRASYWAVGPFPWGREALKGRERPILDVFDDTMVGAVKAGNLYAGTHQPHHARFVANTAFNAIAPKIWLLRRFSPKTF
jgi:hypothetical protein